MSIVPKTAALAASSSYMVTQASGEETPLRKAIRTKIRLRRDDPGLAFIEEELAARYPKLTLVGKLGKGTFSTAYLCTFDQSDGTEGKIVLKMASKRQASKKMLSGMNRLTFERVGGEFMALRDFGEHVITTELAIAYDDVEGKMILVSPEEVQNLFNDPTLREGKNWIFLGSVSQYLEGSIEFFEALYDYRAPLPPESISNYARQIFQAITAVHEASLFHRDINPANMLLVPPKGMSPTVALWKGEGKIVLLDFGFAKLAEGKKRHTFLGTPSYMAPELLRGEEYTTAVDVYAVAATISFMATLANPYFGNQNFFNAADRGIDILGTHVDRFPAVDPKLKDLIKQLGHPNPDHRMSIEDALKHPFIYLEPVATIASSSTTSPLETVVMTEEKPLGPVGDGFVMVDKPNSGPVEVVVVTKKPPRVCSIQ